MGWVAGRRAPATQPIRTVVGLGLRWADPAAITRMRGMLEDENTSRKNAQLKALQEENKRLAQQKRDRENAWRQE